MRILLAPDKFRGSFSAAQICDLLALGIRGTDVAVEVDRAPLADGGEGTLEAVLAAGGGERARIRVTGPLGDPIDAEYGQMPDGCVVIESALICGLEQLGLDRLDPLRATSHGLGMAIAAALDSGHRRFVLGLGGTATVDGGAGMARALGYRILDDQGVDLATTDRLALTASIDGSGAHSGLSESDVTALCDVDCPLLGPVGAARLFGPQKGASPEVVERLEAGLAALSGAVIREKGITYGQMADRPGAGAAGGLGAGAAAFLGAGLRPGAAWLMEMVGFRRRLEACDLVVTGEGSLDRKTLHGKVVAAVLREAADCGRPAVIIAGRWDGTLPTRRPEWIQVITRQWLGLSDGPLDGKHLRLIGESLPSFVTGS